MRKALAVGEQVVELSPVGGELRLEVEQVLENTLHPRDLAAMAMRPPSCSRSQGAALRVVGMRVRLQDPRHVQPLGTHESGHLFGGMRAGAPRPGVEVQHPDRRSRRRNRAPRTRRGSR
jgi:hypothetical protein